MSYACILSEAQRKVKADLKKQKILYAEIKKRESESLVALLKSKRVVDEQTDQSIRITKITVIN